MRYMLRLENSAECTSTTVPKHERRYKFGVLPANLYIDMCVCGLINVDHCSIDWL